MPTVADCLRQHSETFLQRLQKNSDKISLQQRKVSGVKFVRGFMQHALPKEFSKVRYYGSMASNSRTTRDRVKWLVWLYLGWTFWLGSGVAPQPDRFVSKRPPCEHCGGQLRVIGMTNAEGCIICPVLPDHATPYLDSV